MDPLDVALAMRQAFDKFLKKKVTENSYLQKIRVVVFDRNIFQIFQVHAVPNGKIVFLSKSDQTSEE